MNIVLASDHGGFEMKQYVIDYLGQCKAQLERCYGLELTDAGNAQMDAEDDFPMIAEKAVLKMRELGGVGIADVKGIFVCGSGMGICMAANRFHGIRASLCHSAEAASLTRQHNDANVLCLGGRNTVFSDVKPIVDAFLFTEFLGNEKYRKRNAMLDTL